MKQETELLIALGVGAAIFMLMHKSALAAYNAGQGGGQGAGQGGASPASWTQGNTGTRGGGFQNIGWTGTPTGGGTTQV